MDADAFRASVARVLVPELRPGDIVVMEGCWKASLDACMPPTLKC
ncbi:MAG: hypothetical protein AAF318_16740 [Pseudomonadota bacterium]